jgi:serine protease Do
MRPTTPVRTAAAALFGLAVLAPARAGAEDLPAPALADREDARALQAAIEYAAADVSPAVVDVLVERRRARSDDDKDDAIARLLRRVDPEALPEGTGPAPGLIVSPDGVVVTALYRLKDAATPIRVRLAGGSVLEAKLLGTDQRLALAALKLPEGRYPAPRFAEERLVRVGSFVVAVGARDGSPFPPVGLGIVSALERAGGLMLQTDAAIDPGNAGGALVDLRGRVVGVPVLLTRQTGVDSGVGFVVKAEALRAALPALRRGEHVMQGFLGVTLGQEDGSGGGAAIETVLDGTPAERAGLRANDIVVAIDGKPIDGSGALRDQLTARPAGTPCTLTVRRGAKLLALRATLAAAPEE